MVKHILFLFFGCLLTSVFSQNAKIDSLQNIINTTKEDTSKVNAMLEIGAEYKNEDAKKTFEFANKAIDLAEKVNYKKGIASAKYLIGFTSYAKGDFSKAKNYYTEALIIFKDLKMDMMTAKLIYNLGIIAVFQGDYKTALNNFFDALRRYEKLNSKMDVSDATIAIANVYGRLGNSEKELEYHQKSLEMKKELGDKYGIAAAYLNLGNVYAKQGNFEKALEYSKICLSISEEIKNEKWIINASGNIGMIYYQLKKYKEAIEYSLKCLEIAEKTEDKGSLCTGYNNIGTIYLEMGNKEKAKEYYDKALKISTEIGEKNELKNSYQNLAEYYIEKEEYKQAINYLKLYSQIKDSLLNEDITSQMNELQTKYETEKKEQEIELLNKDNELKQTNINKQKTVLFIVIGALALAIVLAFFVLNQYQQKQKANVKLELAYRQIEEKNKDITDSINYAQRIQKAMLPRRRDIWAAFPNSFVLFKPKDIVSGDFYFFSKRDSSYIIAAADCTGHGVPGGFMSMVGAERLTDAAKEGNSPSEILSLLNKGVKKSLKQSGSDDSTRDGMDIALCEIDTINRKVKFAGANRPLWILRKDSQEIEEIKATKKAIGGLTEDTQHFEQYDIQLVEGDAIYIFSDGYADLFGKEGKKLTTKKFKQLLIEIREKSMKEQSNNLKQFAVQWQANTEQIDDILVIGVQL